MSIFLFRSRILSINCFLPVAVLTFRPKYVLQTNEYSTAWDGKTPVSQLGDSSELEAHMCNHHTFHSAVTLTVLTMDLKISKSMIMRGNTATCAAIH